MQNFPLPYPHELIYSVVARAGVHMGLTSPKQLLDEVFRNRKVIAAFDLPCHLRSIIRHFPDSKANNIEKLIYQNTLFPVYAPFVEEDRRKRCLKWMEGISQGATHLALGVAASKVKRLSVLRYCPRCLHNQKMNHGEYYWDRRWQVSGADCCITHGQLVDAQIDQFGYQRHNFIDASPANCPDSSQTRYGNESLCVANQVSVLFDLPPVKSPTYAQWTKYYSHLAQQAGCNRGSQISYMEIKERLLTHWSHAWLDRYNLHITDKSTSWLYTIFRKHRKAFSYLEHIVALESFLPKGWQLTEVIKDVKSLRVGRPKKISKSHSVVPSQGDLDRYRKEWLSLLNHHGIKEARLSGGGAIYAWLYRNDKEWFLNVNKERKLNLPPRNTRVDWPKRDRRVVRQLLKIKNLSNENPVNPQLTKNWFLSQLKRKSTVEKHLSKLPLAQQFFDKYCEGIDAYQMRRISHVVNGMKIRKKRLVKWKILRLSGLSKERITENAAQLLDEIVNENGKATI